ncbi:winged helix-turn-helix transcriptional regulator [Levilactobacillus acidifarinae]|uniref:HTH hxlR-type domain-containing protein n=1 Tax=Levilactobacillus acidifarinae DSM 19394 = JCM 15949 TaxID=1423715 RepID=A0A0R1LSV0_9LACO|nr:helix-turn-helix domain-containing protein [Levilactobacillus acidifarinae]KRK95881.1 hypothetical protein FD25_GL002341 [Levilactobacillus acidifarinae DSM 19394]GEO69181.1 hypothetical protein LAC03_10910 [Levilactobacillus acidifarinae]
MPISTQPTDCALPTEPRDYYHEDCPVLYALGKVDQKWKLPILWQIAGHHGLRYNELKRQVRGVTNTMLTKSLRELESDGLVSRHATSTVPPEVAYRLTLKGKQLLVTLQDLHQWGVTQLKQERRQQHAN